MQQGEKEKEKERDKEARDFPHSIFVLSTSHFHIRFSTRQTFKFNDMKGMAFIITRELQNMCKN